MDRPVLSSKIVSKTLTFQAVEEDLGEGYLRVIITLKLQLIVKKIVYYLDDRMHRDDGPAYIEYNWWGTVLAEEYYLNGYKCTKEQIEEILK